MVDDSLHLFSDGKALFLIIVKFIKFIDRAHERVCTKLLRSFNRKRGEDGPTQGSISRGFEILNTFDPFRVNLSDDDIMESDNATAHEFTPQ